MNKLLMNEAIRQGLLKYYETNPMTDETKAKISASNKKVPRTEEWNHHISEAMIGKPSKRKGTHFKMTEEQRKHTSEGHIKFWAEHPEKKHNIGSKTKEVRKTKYWRGSTKPCSEETKKKLSLSHIGKSHKKSLTRSATYKELWTNPDFAQRMISFRNIKPNKSELQLEGILQELYPNQFKYNGDCRLGIVLNRYIPDFVNINGEKQVIELFGVYWHNQPNRGEYDRIQRYKEVGWNCLIVWDKELQQTSTLISKIKAFVGVPN